jgi:hypothetical protein
MKYPLCISLNRNNSKKTRTVWNLEAYTIENAKVNLVLVTITGMKNLEWPQESLHVFSLLSLIVSCCIGVSSSWEGA